MKPASPTLVALINSGVFFAVTIYTFTTASGLVVRLTDTDFDVIDTSGNVYYWGQPGSGYPAVDSKNSSSRAHWKRGLDTDTWTAVINAQVTDPFTGLYTYVDVAGSTPWLSACRAGLFDNADVVIGRAYFAAPPVLPWSVASRTAVGTLTIFRGLVDTVQVNQIASVFDIADYKSLMTITMPRNLYQSECRHQLFDSGCTLNPATYVALGVHALIGSSRSVVLASIGAPGGSGTWQLGRLVFLTGLNAGFQGTIASWNSGSPESFTMQYPFPFQVNVGDEFDLYPGCDKQISTCTAFGNEINFGGEPYIPDPTVTLG